MTTDEQLARGWFKEGVETFLKDKHAATFNTPDYYYASGYLRAKQEARIAALTKDAELMPLLKDARKELHACQAVIHLAGGFDPAYVSGAQKVLKAIDAAIAKDKP